MVYAGPSKGCATCRRRRVKCDEGRPTCDNCLRLELPCGGYRTNERGFIYKDQTKAVVHSAQKQRQPRHALGQQRKGSPATDSDDEAAEGKVSFFSFFSYPQDPETLALCFFLTNYVLTAPSSRFRGSRGLFADLLPTFSVANPRSTLSLSTKAAALTLTSLWSGPGSQYTAAAGHARQALTAALAGLRADLADPASSLEDQALMSVLLLQFVENLSSHQRVRRAEGEHQNGAVAMVRHRGVHGFQSARARRLLGYVRTTLISGALRRKEDVVVSNPGIWADEGDHLGNDGEEDEEDDAALGNPLAQLDRFGVELCRLQAAWQRYRIADQHSPIPNLEFSEAEADLDVDPDPDAELLSEILSPALSLDQRLATWAFTQPYQPTVLSSYAIPRSIYAVGGIYGDTCTVYPSINVAANWNTYRGYRLLVLRLISACDALAANHHHVSNARGEYVQATAQELVDDVCGSVPFHLGDRTDPAHISEFVDAAGIAFPGYSSTEGEGAGEWESGRNQLIAQGPWHLLGPLIQLLELLSPENNGPGVGFVSVRPGQREWIVGQMMRIFVLQRMRPGGIQRGGGAKGGEELKSVGPEAKESDVGQHVKEVRLSRRYVPGV